MKMTLDGINTGNENRGILNSQNLAWASNFIHLVYLVPFVELTIKIKEFEMTINLHCISGNLNISRLCNTYSKFAINYNSVQRNFHPIILPQLVKTI